LALAASPLWGILAILPPAAGAFAVCPAPSPPGWLTSGWAERVVVHASRRANASRRRHGIGRLGSLWQYRRKPRRPPGSADGRARRRGLECLDRERGEAPGGRGGEAPVACVQLTDLLDHEAETVPRIGVGELPLRLNIVLTETNAR
jgi:hypothetical protein